jgi:hypothetical protein
LPQLELLDIEYASLSAGVIFIGDDDENPGTWSEYANLKEVYFGTEADVFATNPPPGISHRFSRFSTFRV